MKNIFKLKINFTVKLILIIAIFAAAIIVLSYDENTNDSDDYRFGFPLEINKK